MIQTQKHQLTNLKSSHHFARAKSQTNPVNVNPQNTISLFTDAGCFKTIELSPEYQVAMQNSRTGEKFRPVEPQRSKQEV